MKLLPDWIKNGYLRLIDPVATWLVKRGVHPNTITVVGTLCTVAGGIIYGTGHIRTGGFFLGITALFYTLLFGYGTIVITEAAPELLQGTIGGDGWSLKLHGSRSYGSPAQVRFQYLASASTYGPWHAIHSFVPG